MSEADFPCGIARMRSLDMTRRRTKAEPNKEKKSQVVDSAFDIWLNRGLHELFDEVAREPVPEKFLKLIDERSKE